MNFPIVSIIIVNFNVKEFLIQCIDSINQTDYLGETEIIIIDNHAHLIIYTLLALI